ncbi:MAG TPA: hypothetical protein VGJ51_03635 [Candidatus Angelobacter sp.]
MCRLALFASLALASVSSLAQINQAPTNFTGTNNSQIVKIQQNGTGFGLSTSSKANAPAIYGQATPTTGPTFAIWGDVFSPGGIGVRGESHSTTGGAGVVGITHAGTANLGDGNAVGVHGTGQVAPGVKAIGVLGDVPNGLNSVGGVGVMGHVFLMTGDGCCSTAGVFWNEFGDGADILVGQTFAAPNQKVVFRVDTFGDVHIAGNLFTNGADFAENVAVNGNKSGYAAGDVLVIDSAAERRLTRTSRPYSTLVAGIYSTRPGVLAGSRMEKAANPDVPLAVVGIVPCKVTAENGAIQAGDLLVTSSKAGFAMKGTNRKKMMGAVLGKALQPLPQGDGVIQVLVTLQ